jgi:hypothetical protein
VRGRGERGGGGRTKKGKESSWLMLCAPLLPGPLLYIGGGCTLPFPQGTKGGGLEGEAKGGA